MMPAGPPSEPMRNLRGGLQRGGLAIEPDAFARADMRLGATSDPVVVREKDRFEAIAVRGSEVAAGTREHLVTSRIDERGDLGHALVLILAVSRLGRVIHVEPQR